nr:LysR substrate-binding domain-containing protein [Trichocoleus sp. FACHB-40]
MTYSCRRSIDEQLREQGLKQRIMLTINQFTLVPKLIAKSDSIAAIPARILQKNLYLEQLHIVELPIGGAPPELQMIWTEQKQRDPAHEWLRSQLSEIFKH